MLCKYRLPPHNLGHLFCSGTADFASWLCGRVVCTEALQGYVARSGPGPGGRFSPFHNTLGQSSSKFAWHSKEINSNIYIYIIYFCNIYMFYMAETVSLTIGWHTPLVCWGHRGPISDLVRSDMFDPCYMCVIWWSLCYSYTYRHIK